MRRKRNRWLKRSLKLLKLKIESKYYWYRFKVSTVGTKEWLIGAELKYSGGRHGWPVRIQRKRVSNFDRREIVKPSFGYATGADRMLHHGYANCYSKYLKQFRDDRPSVSAPVVCEIGILNGTGLAIWCDLFTSSRVIGLDIDPSNFEDNIDNLLDFGAFTKNHPEVFEFDQFVNNSQYVGEILNGDKIDVCIDDGCHKEEAICMTFKSMLPHLNNHFVYFIEDNPRVHAYVRHMYEKFTVHSFGQLTVVTN